MTDKYKKAIDEAESSIEPKRIERVKDVQNKIDDLKSRGLLRKQAYKSFATSGFGEQNYVKNKLKNC